VEIIGHEGMTIAGLLVHAPWQELRLAVPEQWRRVFAATMQYANLRQMPHIDVCLGCVDGSFMQLLGVPVGSALPLPDHFEAVHIPPQRVLHHRHEGPVSEITRSFGDMYSWASERSLPVGEFRLDYGYTEQGNECTHELFIGLLPETPWRHATPSRTLAATTDT
jgi:predicted transcriptional regulator YdeE